MRSLLNIVATSGILLGCHTQPSQPQPVLPGPQLTQSTAPLPPDPTTVQPLQEPGQQAPMPKPSPEDVGSPSTAPTPTPDAGVADPDAASQPPNAPATDAPVYIPPVDTSEDEEP